MGTTARYRGHCLKDNLGLDNTLYNINLKIAIISTFKNIKFIQMNGKTRGRIY